MEKKEESLQELDAMVKKAEMEEQAGVRRRGSPRPCDFGRKYWQLHKNKAGCSGKP